MQSGPIFVDPKADVIFDLPRVRIVVTVDVKDACHIAVGSDIGVEVCFPDVDCQQVSTLVPDPIFLPLHVGLHEKRGRQVEGEEEG